MAGARHWTASWRLTMDGLEFLYVRPKPTHSLPSIYGGSYLTIKSASAHCDTWRIPWATWKYIWLYAWKMA